MKIYNMKQIKDEQKENYANRIGKEYGDFVVTDVRYDWSAKKQIWKMKCKECGFLWESRNKDDITRGRTKCVCPVCSKRKRDEKNAERAALKEENAKAYRESLPSHPKWVGMIFGGWQVLGYDPKESAWKVRCTHCGKETKRKVAEVKSLTAKRCFFCLWGDRNENRDRIHTIWFGMRRRCRDKNDSNYHNYGGRGISVCPEWENSFEAFYEWAVANGYAPGLSIDRIDVNGNYEPGNCRWATSKEQANNTRSNKCYVINGERKTLSEWCEIYGAKYGRVKSRLSKGWYIEEALTTPVGVRKGGRKAPEYEIDGVSKTLDEWCSIYGVVKGTVVYRIKKMGMSLSEALTTANYSIREGHETKNARH